MIIGIGSDLIDIRRVEKVMSRHGARFIRRCFTDIEKEKADTRQSAGTHIDVYAKRFAAKEALSKALGTGFNHGVYMRDIGVVNDKDGRPTLKLTGGALEKLNMLIPEGKTFRIHLTLSDEPPLAKALVIIEAI